MEGDVVERICVVCGAMFDAKTNGTKCSHECRISSRRKNVVKTCIICGKVFTVTSGPQKTCSKDCQRQKDNKYKRDYCRENPEVKREYARRDRERRKEKIAIQKKRWREENPEKYREGNRRNYLKDPASRVEYTRLYRMNNPEYRRDHYKRTRDNILKTHRNWIRDNLEKHTKTKVKHHLKSQLGFNPPPDLVEEANAIRLLRRAIKKAGE